MRSSILGGAAIVELSNFEEDGVPPTQFVYQESYVYADNERIYKSGKYELSIPNTGSWMKVYPNGSSGQFTMPEERSPLGGEIPLIDPNVGMTYQELRGDQPMFIEGGDPFDLSGGCVLDGMPVPCGMINANAHTECPDGNCGPRVVEMCVPLLGTMYEACGTQLTSPFMAFADGSSGFGYNGLLLPEEDQTVSVSLADFRSMRAEQIMSASAFGPGRGQKGKGETKVKKKRSIVKRKGKPIRPPKPNTDKKKKAENLNFDFDLKDFDFKPLAKAPTPDEDTCNADYSWPQRLTDMRNLSNHLGWTISDTGIWSNKAGYSFKEVNKRLGEKGFILFRNLNYKDHSIWDFSYEGRINGRWYHIVVTSPGLFKTSKPPSNIHGHCERYWLRPNSVRHLFN
jgi:hypothetical protein